MAVTIVATQQKVAGQDAVPSFTAKAEYVLLTGTIANADTGTYTPKGQPLLDGNGVPIIVGMPHGISWAIANGIITFTCFLAAGFTNMNLDVAILCKK